MKRVLVLALAFALACDQKDEPADASPLLALPSPTAVPSQAPTSPSSSVSPQSASVSPLPSARAPTGDAGLACGKKPLPDCPLQAWMKENMTPPMNAKDWQGMAASLDRSASLAPAASAGYTNWVSIAHDGANAARAAELDAVKAACRGCHDQYKNKYRAEMRTRPLP